MFTPRIGSAYMVLAVGVVAGLFFSWINDNEIEEINRKQTQFILSQCRRDKERNEIIVEALEAAKDRTIITYKNYPILRLIETGRIERQIEKFKTSEPCELP